jgi:SpoIID/LytB domain protein
MAQDGAYWMGRTGASTATILAHFYPGTRLSSGGGLVRVWVANSPSGTVGLAFPAGGQLRDERGGAQSPGFPVEVPAGGRVMVRFDGTRYSVHADTSEAGTALLPTTRVVNRSATAGSPAIIPTTAPVGSATGAPPSPLPVPPPSNPSSPPGSTTTTTSPTRPSPKTTAPTSTTTTTTTVPSSSTTPMATTTTTGARSAPPPVPALPPGLPAESSVSTAPATTTRPVWALAARGSTVVVPALGRRYRGVLQVVGGGPSPSPRLVNHLDVEEYLRGMGEVLNASWPAASLRAQAIAARTYALRAMAGAGELCSDQRCQVYLGQQVEYPAMDQAVAESAGQVLTFDGRLASTVYSANGGGTSASREEGFGPAAIGSDGDFGYLRPARYPTHDPLPWSVTVPLGAVADKLGYAGDLSSVAVTRAGPSGRALAVTVDGSRGPRTVSGVDFAAALALRSTLFRLRLATADGVPPLPGSPAPLPFDPGPAMDAQAPIPSGAAPPVARKTAPGSAGDASDEPANSARRPRREDRCCRGWWSYAPLLVRAQQRRPGPPSRCPPNKGLRPWAVLHAPLTSRNARQGP